MENIKLNNTNCFGATEYSTTYVTFQKSTYGGIFSEKNCALLESDVANHTCAQIGDVEDAYKILDKKISDSPKKDFKEYMRFVAETVQEYFGDYSNIESRIKNYPDEDEVDFYGVERGKVSNLKGKNAAACLERAMLSQNLLKYISNDLKGLESYFKETGIENQIDEDKTKREVHAFNLVSYDGKYFIFDSTMPKGSKNNLEPLVGELPKEVFDSLVESPFERYAIDLKYVSALTGKLKNYTLDYNGKNRYKVTDSKVVRKFRRKIFYF